MMQRGLSGQPDGWGDDVRRGLSMDEDKIQALIKAFTKAIGQ